MKAHIYQFCFSLIWLPFLLSCQDNRLENLSADKIYIAKSGIIESMTYALNNGEVSVELWTIKSGLGDNSGTVTYYVNEALVEEYNLGLDDDQKVILLPSDCYRFSQTEFTVSSSQAAKFTLYYNPDKIGADYGYDKKFMLPISIKSNDIAVNSTKNTTTLILEVRNPVIGFVDTPSKNISVKRKDTEYKEKLNFGVDFENIMDIALDLEVGTQQLVEEYNEKNETTYTLLPADSYTVSNLNPVLVKGVSEVAVECNINSKNIPGGKYILPVKIKSAAPYVVGAEDQIRYYTFENVSEWCSTKDEKSGWSLVNTMSFADNDSGRPENIIDGSLSTYWSMHYGITDFWQRDENGVVWIIVPQWIVIDLGKEMNIGGLKWYPRAGNGIVMDYDFFAATAALDESIKTPAIPAKGAANFRYTGTYDSNENIWTKVASFQRHSGSVKEMLFDKPQKARYIQVRAVKGPNSCCMGELDVLEMK